MSDFKELGNKLSGAAGWIGALLAFGGSILNYFQQKKTNKELMEFNRTEADIQRQWTEVQTAKQNTWNQEQWKKQNEYNTPEAQKERLADAGLNPMYYGIDGIPAAQLTAAQPLAYERASLGSLSNPFGSLIDAVSKLKDTDNSTKLANAQIDKMNQETGGLKLDNQFKEETLAAREEGVKLANEATKKQIEQVESQIKVNEQNVKKLAAETDNEIEKKGLIIAEKLLAQAKEKEIIEMLPLNKQLVKAQTDAQKANAAAAWANAAIQKGLLDGGYVEAQLNEIAARIRKEEGLADDAKWKARQDELKAAIMSGNAFDLSDKDPISRGIGKVANSFFSIISVASNAGFAGIKL